jgi:hypothetical protein
LSPHIGDDDDVLESIAAAEFPKVPSRYSGHLEVGDSVDVKDPSKLLAPLVSAKRNTLVET